jgi:hypothetical protein
MTLPYTHLSLKNVKSHGSKKRAIVQRQTLATTQHH